MALNIGEGRRLFSTKAITFAAQLAIQVVVNCDVGVTMVRFTDLPRTPPTESSPWRSSLVNVPIQPRFMQVHSTKQPSALVVEEDEHIAYLLKFMLEQEGYEVALARDGREARALVQTRPPPHIALLNARLPFVDGFELVGLIRASATWRCTPILMLLATTREPEVVRALEAGVTACVQKPFAPNELMAQIHCHAKVPS